MPIQGTILLVYHSSKIPQGLNNMCQDVRWGYHLFTIITYLITNIQRYKKSPCTAVAKYMGWIGTPFGKI